MDFTVKTLKAANAINSLPAPGRFTAKTSNKANVIITVLHRDILLLSVTVLRGHGLYRRNIQQGHYPSLRALLHHGLYRQDAQHLHNTCVVRNSSTAS